MNYNISKENVIGISAAVVFHALVFLALLFVYLTPMPKADLTEEMLGVPVMFGNVPDALGDDEPFGTGTAQSTYTETASTRVVEDPLPMAESTAKQQTKSVENTYEVLATQETEETIAIKEANRIAEEQKARAAEEQRAKAEAERIAQQEAAKRARINQQMMSSFGGGDPNSTGSRGETSGTGTQGVPTGNASYGATSGIGGWGSYALAGRSLGTGGLIKPRYVDNDYGTVVVNILVDPRGNVLEATIGRGTNTTSTKLKEEALKAARKTKFNEVTDLVNQRGSITYIFDLN